MPRIDDFWIRSAVHIYRSVEDAKNPKIADEQRRDGSVRGASGCLYTEFTSVQGHCYVLTNKHVVDGGGTVPKVFLGDSVRVIDAVKDDWIVGETEDDLAVLPVDLPFIPESLVDTLCLTEEKEDEWDIGVGDDVFMVGRFFGQPDRPVARFGNIAAWPARSVYNECLKRNQESILIEMRSHNGYSGSPVFLYIHPGTPRPLMNNPNPNIGPQRWVSSCEEQLFFIGIDWGHIGNTAMAAVVPWYKVTALMNCDRLKDLRERADRAASSQTTLDREGNSKNATEDKNTNP